jgi:hypothetical protein
MRTLEMNTDTDFGFPKKGSGWIRALRGEPTHAGWILGLLAGAAALRIAVYVCCAAPFEDALITMRYSCNIARGLGFVYNPGERVLGTTTPLWTLINAFYVWLFGSSRVFAFGFWLDLGLDLLMITAIFAVLVGAGNSVAASAGAVLPLACFSPFVFITSSGLETSLFMALFASSLLALQRGRAHTFAALAGLLALCRPEGLLWGGLGLLTLIYRRRRIPWKEAAAMAAVVAPWLAFAHWYFGRVVPQSALAKAPWTFQSLGHVLFTGARELPGTLLALVYLNPFPTLPGPHFAGIAAAAQILLVALFLAGARVALSQSGPRELVLFFVTLVCFYASAAPGVRFYWYGVPVSLLFYPLVMLGLFRLTRVVFGRITLRGRPPESPFWGTGCGVVACGLLGMLVVQAHNLRLANLWEQNTRKALGIVFATRTPHDTKIMLEPIGYIGFYSHRYVYDLAGVVSPSIVDLRKRFPTDWYSRAIFSLSPDYLVLRKFEIERNTCFVGGGKLFQSEEERARFSREYSRVREFSGMAAHRSEAQLLVVFRKAGTTDNGPPI